MPQIKVILSTFGPLHLLKSAEYLSRYVNISVIQGWVPRWWNKWFLTIASKIVGRNLYKAFERRTPDRIKANHSVAIPEFYLWACKLFGLQSPRKYSYNAAKLYGLFSKPYIKKADIFHVRGGSGFSGAIEKAKRLGMKIVVDYSIAHPAFMDKQLRPEFEKNNEIFYLGLDNPFWQSMITECHKADIILVNSQFVKDTFVEQGFHPDKIKVVYLGVRQDFNGLKTNYEIHDTTLKILFTGSFGFRKGAEYILRALAELDNEEFKYEFTCVGDSSWAENLIQSIAPKHLKRVNTVPQDDLKSYLANSDVYLFPSLCEGCASSGMEALSSGLPVIATKESGLPIENGVDGLIIDSKNPMQIKDTLKNIASDKGLREKLGTNAKLKFRSDFSWDIYAQKVSDIYLSLL